MNANLNDLQAALDAVDRVHRARERYYRERLPILARILGDSHPTVIAAAVALSAVKREWS